MDLKLRKRHKSYGDELVKSYGRILIKDEDEDEEKQRFRFMKFQVMNMSMFTDIMNKLDHQEIVIFSNKKSLCIRPATEEEIVRSKERQAIVEKEYGTGNPKTIPIEIDTTMKKRTPEQEAILANIIGFILRIFDTVEESFPSIEEEGEETYVMTKMKNNMILSSELMKYYRMRRKGEDVEIFVKPCTHELILRIKLLNFSS